jgi:transposase
LEVLRGKRKKREVLPSEGIGWETLKKILVHPEPPRYRLKEPRSKPKIGTYLGRIAQIIEEDKVLPKKQRHAAKLIYERIREMGYGGKYTQVEEAVRGLLRVKIGGSRLFYQQFSNRYSQRRPLRSLFQVHLTGSKTQKASWGRLRNSKKSPNP